MIGTILRAVVAGTAILHSTAGFAADAYPSKPIRLIVPYAPGGATDIAGRLLATRLTSLLNQNVIVENKAGATGAIGVQFVARAQADGYTLALATAAPITVMPVLQKSVGYNPREDIIPVATVAETPMILVASSKSSIRTLQDIKSRKEGTTAASASAVLQMGVDMLAASLGVRIDTVNYKGSSEAKLDVIAGRVDLLPDTIASALPHIANGDFRPIAAFGAKRTSWLPDLPTMAELGVPDADIAGWTGVMAPKGTPPEVVQKLQEAVLTVGRDPTFVAELRNAGLIPLQKDSKAFHAMIEADLEKNRAAAQRTGLRPQ